VEAPLDTEAVAVHCPLQPTGIVVVDGTGEVRRADHGMPVLDV
jgi:hypothetical protein